MVDNDWLVVDLPLWKMMEFVNWDDDIPNMMGKIKAMFQTTNQNIVESNFPNPLFGRVYVNLGWDGTDVPTHLFVSASTEANAPRPCLLENQWETMNLGHPWISPPPIPETRKLLREIGKNFPNSATQWGFALNLPLFTESKSLCI